MEHKPSLPSLLWLQIKCKSELRFRVKLTKVEQMYYLLHICYPRKYSFGGANTRYCTMFTRGEKFDKDGSVHTFTRIIKAIAKTVITVFASIAIKVQI